MRHTLDNKQQHMHTSDSHDGALELCYNCLHCSHDLTFGVANLSAFSLYTLYHSLTHIAHLLPLGHCTIMQGRKAGAVVLFNVPINALIALLHCKVMNVFKYISL